LLIAFETYVPVLAGNILLLKKASCLAGSMESAYPALAGGENNVLPVLAGNVPVVPTLRVRAAPPLRGPAA
jgi:hypothetical protein